jgi:hypothetical protein
VKRVSTTAAITMTRIRLSGNVAPASSMVVRGSSAGWETARVPKNSWATALRTAASPIVTMITLIALSPIRGRRMSRSIRTPITIANRIPSTTARTSGSWKTTKAA